MSLPAKYVQLRSLQGAWLQGPGVDSDELQRTQAAIAVDLHQLHCASIPAYRALSADFGLLECADARTILEHLWVDADMFKSYSSSALACREFKQMRTWLETVSSCKVPDECDRVTSLDEWSETLRLAGVALSYSSGTGGSPSIVPRDARSIQLNAHFSSPRMQHRLARMGCDLEKSCVIALCFAVGAHGLTRFARSIAAASADAVFLWPSSSMSGQEDGIAPDWNGVLARIYKAEQDQQPLVFVATPHALRELCRRVSAPLTCPSTAFVGGGWKNHTSEQISRKELLREIEDSLGCNATQVDEAYSMVECGTAFNACEHGRFHVPPSARVALLDSAGRLGALSGRGQIVVTDLTAISIPASIALHDVVTLHDDPCACGLVGPSIGSDIARLETQAPRACGVVIGEALARS